MVTPYQTEHVREQNRRTIYCELRARRTATRADLATSTGLSAPTVAAILAELQVVGLVADAGTVPDTGGRPAQRVRFVADAAHVLAVDLSGRHAQACRIDLAGDVRERHQGPTLRHEVRTALLEWLAPLVAAEGKPPVRRVALAVPGVVDLRDRHVDLAPALGWHAVPVAEYFETALGVSVTLENNVNALALAELHYGVAADHRHVLFTSIGSGFGAGVMIDGQLYRGAHAAAGEIGSAIACDADVDDPLEQAEPGPLERRVVALAERCLDQRGQLGFQTHDARRAFTGLVALLGPVLHNLACLLDPELIVVSWPSDPSGRLAARLREDWRGPRPVPVLPATLGRDGAARGVARLALEGLEDGYCRSRMAAPVRGTPAAAPDGADGGATSARRSHHA